jgi:hypothetical protein
MALRTLLWASPAQTAAEPIPCIRGLEAAQGGTTMNRMSKRSVLLALAGIGLSCCMGALPVSADDRETYADPMPLSYPYAAPGMLDMWHWTDYTRTKLEPGSVNDVQFERDKRMREKMEQK